MSNNIRHGNSIVLKNYIPIKSQRYSVTTVNTKFVQLEFNRVIQEELIDINFAKV